MPSTYKERLSPQAHQLSDNLSEVNGAYKDIVSVANNVLGTSFRTLHFAIPYNVPLTEEDQVTHLLGEIGKRGLEKLPDAHFRMQQWRDGEVNAAAYTSSQPFYDRVFELIEQQVTYPSWIYAWLFDIAFHIDEAHKQGLPYEEIAPVLSQQPLLNAIMGIRVPGY